MHDESFTSWDELSLETLPQQRASFSEDFKQRIRDAFDAYEQKTTEPCDA